LLEATRMMRITMAFGTLAVLSLANAITGVAEAESHTPNGPSILIDDVSRFYAIYDATSGHPSAEVLQRDYLDAGTQGVRDFIPLRIISAARLAEQIQKDPGDYDKARSCVPALPSIRMRLGPIFRKLGRLYPEARFPPVTILVGRDNTGGVSSASGVLIGLEVTCATLRPGQTITDRFVHLIAHEYAHVEQSEFDGEPTLLRQCLVEGVAELIAELTSGEISNSQLLSWTRGHEREIGESFLRDADGTDRSNWLYNGLGTPQQPGDLGYWVGYRISRAYYYRAHDKRAAIRDLLRLEDPRRILNDSGWKPGR
jgi:Predicted Zn-dependent protease (DUF2268)